MYLLINIHKLQAVRKLVIIKSKKFSPTKSKSFEFFAFKKKLRRFPIAFSGGRGADSSEKTAGNAELIYNNAAGIDFISRRV